jgi:hypothetical protein
LPETGKGAEFDEARPPAQSHAQRMNALEKANRIRHQRAQVKRDLRRGTLKIVPLLVDPPECVLSAVLSELLLAVPGLGKVRVNRVLSRCRISTSKRVGGLSDRQRNELLEALEDG